MQNPMVKSLSSSQIRDVIIIGSGSAGLTAAIYTARAILRPLVIGGFIYGGQLMLTSEVENYPGFIDGVLGPNLMNKMTEQAKRFGAEIIYEDVTKVDFHVYPFKVYVEDRLYEGRTVILATGASSKWLGLESEKRLLGRGVSSCATCDGPLFKNKRLVVVGGGDSAMEEAIFLTRFASKVTVVHRRDKLRASKIMQDRAMKNPKIAFVWDSIVTDVLGSERVAGVKIKNLKTGVESILECEGFFVAIGHEPNTKIFRGQIELDEQGYIVTKNETETSVSGVFAAGDVYDTRYRQAITAAGSGCKAALDAEKWLEARQAAAIPSR